MIQKNFRKGIAMVELIFALVIMGIVLLSAPILIQQSIKSSNVALQQESIVAVASHTGILLSKNWDENNTEHTLGISPILKIANASPGSDFNLSGVDFDNNVSGRTSSVANQTFNASTQLNNEDGEFDDIDDYNGVPVTLSVFSSENSSVGSLGDYVDQSITINTSISYANDRPTSSFNQATINAGNNIFTNPDLGVGTQSHIKFIQTNLVSTAGVDELNKSITLNAFSCNLGTFSIGGKQY